ncbi:hypothetical protein [Nonomuraea guangzhouensis]|uniref:Uncharacterized protein n=1 Tax=Nonomuraea guangzhouensis TaxID=1291555 RepID=A0ABW4G6I0_9ACTN|nr:hypothetical protein [Nonomuraea guangzhouensis]
MTTWTQDYPALPGSAHAAARLAHALATARSPRRASAAYRLVEHLFGCALARSSPSSNLNLIIVIEDGKIHFEVHYPNDHKAAFDTATAYQTVSALADAYGEGQTRRGRMIYAELWVMP